MDYRIEKDSMGEIKVPVTKYWGAQTQRSYQNFAIGEERMPLELISALALVKKSAARANYTLQKLDQHRCEIICEVCDLILRGELYDEFPLSIWQTGSGTQTNMNINEVIANKGNEIAKGKIIHPNDHVNMSQSSNDTFPTAMHIAAVQAIMSNLVPSLNCLIEAFNKLENDNRTIIKIARTHLQDATPISFAQEISGWRGMLENSKSKILVSLAGIETLALGGTAVGTGLNAPKDFAELSVREIAQCTGISFHTSNNKFHALSSKDDITFAHGALKTLAMDLMKIANDIRWLASGPRCGLGEISIPANEPGSSIMPGKVNPTQCEAMTMVAVQIAGNDTTVSFAASQGNFQLNTFMPVIIYNFLQSVRLLSDVMCSFRIHCVEGIKANVDNDLLPEKVVHLKREKMIN